MKTRNIFRIFFPHYGDDMKKVLIILAIAILSALPSDVMAAPFLVSNPVTYTLAPGQTMSFNVTGLPASFASATNSPAVANAVHLDLSGLAAGSYSLTVTTCVNDPSGYQECGTTPSAPFAFTVPAAPSAPTGLGLSTK
jgi:hypothetical protein